MLNNSSSSQDSNNLADIETNLAHHQDEIIQVVHNLRANENYGTISIAELNLAELDLDGANPLNPFAEVGFLQKFFAILLASAAGLGNVLAGTKSAYVFNSRIAGERMPSILANLAENPDLANTSSGLAWFFGLCAGLTQSALSYSSIRDVAFLKRPNPAIVHPSFLCFHPCSQKPKNFNYTSNEAMIRYQGEYKEVYGHNLLWILKMLFATTAAVPTAVFTLGGFQTLLSGVKSQHSALYYCLLGLGTALNIISSIPLYYHSTDQGLKKLKLILKAIFNPHGSVCKKIFKGGGWVILGLSIALIALASTFGRIQAVAVMVLNIGLKLNWEISSGLYATCGILGVATSLASFCLYFVSMVKTVLDMEKALREKGLWGALPERDVVIKLLILLILSAVVFASASGTGLLSAAAMMSWVGSGSYVTTFATIIYYMGMFGSGVLNLRSSYDTFSEPLTKATKAVVVNPLIKLTKNLVNRFNWAEGWSESIMPSVSLEALGRGFSGLSALSNNGFNQLFRYRSRSQYSDAPIVDV